MLVGVIPNVSILTPLILFQDKFTLSWDESPDAQENSSLSANYELLSTSPKIRTLSCQTEQSRKLFHSPCSYPYGIPWLSARYLQCLIKILYANSISTLLKMKSSTPLGILPSCLHCTVLSLAFSFKIGQQQSFLILKVCLN